jgi:hypothetical protein
MSRKKPRIQECVKKLYGKCLICEESRYETLQCHRVVPGAQKGIYHHRNIVVLCSNCHSLVTAGKIIVHAIHNSTYAQFVVHYTDDKGIEYWRTMKPN